MLKNEKKIVKLQWDSLWCSLNSLWCSLKQPQALTPGSPRLSQTQVQIQQAPQHSPALCYFFLKNLIKTEFYFHFVQKILWWARNLVNQQKYKKNCVSKMTDCFQRSEGFWNHENEFQRWCAMLKSLSSPTSILKDMTKYIPDIVKIKFSNWMLVICQFLDF